MHCSRGIMIDVLTRFYCTFFGGHEMVIVSKTPASELVANENFTQEEREILALNKLTDKKEDTVFHASCCATCGMVVDWGSDYIRNCKRTIANYHKAKELLEKRDSKEVCA